MDMGKDNLEARNIAIPPSPSPALQEPEIPVENRVVRPNGPEATPPGEIEDSSPRDSRDRHDLIAKTLADLCADCEEAFSRRSSLKPRQHDSAFSSHELQQDYPDKENSHSDSDAGIEAYVPYIETRERGRKRSRVPESSDGTELRDSNRTSTKSSLSRPSSSKNSGIPSDSAISLIQPNGEKRVSKKSRLRDAQSAESDEDDAALTSEGEQDDEYPSTAHTVLIMMSLYISIFLVALDRTIIGPAIPAITNQFDSINDIGWYGSAYMLTAAGFILLYGRIYTFFPTKPIFLSGIFLFEAGSAICGAAQSSIMLIIGRAIAGLGSSGVFTGAILIMLNTVPLHKRPMLQGLFGACFGVASVAGPLLGGAFTGSKATWRWCFYINLPLGGLTILVVGFLLHLDEEKPQLATWKETFKHLDPLGTMLFLPSITCLVLALEWGAAELPWNAPRLIALLVVFAVLFVAFIVWQYFTRHTTATVPMRVFSQRSVACGGLSQFCVGASMVTASLYIPLWFQAIKNVSAIQSGINTIPLVLSVVVGSISSGGLVQKIGYYTPFMIIGSSLMAVGMGLITTWNTGTSTGMWIGYQAIFGLGVGYTIQHPNIAIQTVLPRNDIPIGTAVMTLCQTLGGAVFAAVGQNLYIDKFSRGLEQIGGIDPKPIFHSGATELTNGVPPALQGQVLKAYNLALTQGTFFAALIVACLGVPAALGMEWRSVKEKNQLQQKRASRDVEKQQTPMEELVSGGILESPVDQPNGSETSDLPLPTPPVPAWKKLYRSSGQFSSYLTAKINPDLRAELKAQK